MFERFISIVWSGSGAEDQRVNLRVVEANRRDVEGAVVDPPNARVGTRAWTRAECREWLVQALKPDQPRCLVAMDFGFGYPWGTDGAVFGCLGWRQMLRAVAEVYEREGSARRAAESINLRPVFGGHGPYRFNQNRTDFRFYLDERLYGPDVSEAEHTEVIRARWTEFLDVNLPQIDAALRRERWI